MPDAVPNAELMRSLGRLVRGLSALFWGLPAALIICVWTVRPQWLRSFGLVPLLACTGLLVYGLLQLGAFQKQERVWRSALDRATILGLTNFLLSPFLYWWSKVPENTFFLIAVLVMAVSSLLFLVSLNLVLQRLTAMLPDEALRLEARHYTTLNVSLLLLTLLFGAAFFALLQFQNLSLVLAQAVAVLERSNIWFLLLIGFVLLPLAMTMALLWKTKEVILDNVFGPKT